MSDTTKTASEIAAEGATKKEETDAEETADAATPDPSGYRNKYVGPEKIRGVVAEGDISTITIKNNSSYSVPTIILPRIITNEKNEHGGSFQDLKIAAVAKDILILLEKAYHLRLGELDRLTSFLNNVALNDHAAATSILWGKHRTQIALSDISKILSDKAEELKKIKENVSKDPGAQETIQRQRAEYMARQNG